MHALSLVALDATAMADAVPASPPTAAARSMPDVAEPTPIESTAVQLPNLLKRKQSPERNTDGSSKRARTSPVPAPNTGADPSRADEEEGETPTQPAEHKDASGEPDQPGTAPEQGTEAASRRRPSQAVDERKRGRRLFGAVLGALGQNSSPALARRREIDRKQREKLRAQAQEDDVAREARLAKLTAVRRREQRRFDAQGLRIRHSNMLAMAHSLYTATEPRLYYRPWKLSREDEDRIERQVKRAQEAIAIELAEFEEKEAKQDENERDRSGEKKSSGDGRDDTGGADGRERDEEMQDAAEGGVEGRQDEPEGPGADSKPADEEPTKNMSQREEGEEKTKQEQMVSHTGDDPDDGGDEVEEGMDGDDAVLY